MSSERRQCSYVIDGPKIGRLVAWRKPCTRVTTRESGRCWQHEGVQKHARLR